ncbi:MAG: hypothetical protein JNL18_22810 [Planctomycetaceae bacterium]|nr:hypothetical protein [Planctomycetaceae bacterium]
MAHEISRETLEKLKADRSAEAATLLKDYQRAVRSDELVVVDEPDGTKSLVEFNDQGQCCTRPLKPK